MIAGAVVAVVGQVLERIEEPLCHGRGLRRPTCGERDVEATRRHAAEIGAVVDDAQVFQPRCGNSGG